LNRFLLRAISTVSFIGFAALPLAASALTVGISSQVDSSLTASRTHESNSSGSWSRGDSSSRSYSNQQGNEYSHGGGMSGGYHESGHDASFNHENYGSYNHSSSSMSGLSVDKSVTHTVGIFVNP
jgi:hypothetical protein